jgi:hypothetical protein
LSGKERRGRGSEGLDSRAEVVEKGRVVNVLVGDWEEVATDEEEDEEAGGSSDGSKVVLAFSDLS